MYVATVLKPAQTVASSCLCLTFFLSIVLIIPNHVTAQFCVKTMVLESAPSEGEITLKK